MGGSYYGGGTIIGPGMRWSDASDFPAGSTPIAKKKRRKKKKCKLNVGAVPAEAARTLEKPLLSQRQLGLLSVVMSDLGRSLPRKTVRVNAVVRTLQADGLVLADGELNRKHPELLRWLEKMEKKTSE